MVYRVYVEKKPGFDLEAKSTLADLKSNLGIEALKDVRMFNRYDAENMSKEQFDYAVRYVFSEPQMDVACEMPDFGDAKVFAVEFLPGQEGLVHISELADRRINRTEDVVKMGEEIWVKCLSVEDNGKVRLSRRPAMADRKRMA